MPVRFNVRVIPNAGRNELIVQPDGSLKVKLQAVPEDGKANRALCALLADHYGCRAREVLIISGDKGRNKLVELPGGPG